MNFLQKLLIAPTALGLIAPLSSNADEVNLNNISNYSSTGAEVNSAQFSDVVPGDWAYTALQNLSESYGCVDNSYTQNLKNGQALTRYEAAALVNACLEGGLASADVSADAARLTNEFGTEMAILKGRVDGLEYKVKELSAGQFSSSTKMMGQAVFTTGFIDTPANGPLTGTDDNKLTTEYSYMLMTHTSFTGKDHLFASIDQGNHNDLVMDSAMNMVMSSLTVSSLFYQFPVGDFQITAGPLVDQDDVISASTSTYSDSFRLSGMRYGASGGMMETGPGVAIEYFNESGFNGSISLVSDDGKDSTKGMFTNEGDDIITTSIGYDSEYYGGGLIYKSADDNGDSNGEKTFGGGVYFRPDGLPTISVMYDTKDPEGSGGINNDSSSFMVGLDYEVGPGTLSAAWESLDQATINSGDQSTSNYELSYNYPVSDGIALQGGMFVEEGTGTQADTIGYVVETFFTF